jgi:Ca2+-binding RTX toxin-like protein
VTEALESGWGLTGLSCSTSIPGGDTTSTSLVTRTATLDVDAGEAITCTFVNSQVPTECTVDPAFSGNEPPIVILGTPGNDTNATLITTSGGTAGVQVIFGFGGDDVLSSGTAKDCIIGGPGNDTLSGGQGEDILVGDEGNDTLNGNDGNDRLFGGSGNDTLNGGGGDDELHGGEDNDTLNGDNNNDTLHGDAGDDILNGGSQNDTLFGGTGADTMDGGNNNDSCDGDTAVLNGDGAIDTGVNCETEVNTNDHLPDL